MLNDRIKSYNEVLQRYRDFKSSIDSYATMKLRLQQAQ